MSHPTHPAAVPIEPVRAFDLPTQWRLHQVAWNRARNLPPGSDRTKHLLVMGAGVLCVGLYLLIAALTAYVVLWNLAVVLPDLLDAGTPGLTGYVLALAALALIAVLSALIAVSVGAGGSPASAFLVRLMLGQLWTTPERDAVATSLGIGQRRRIVNHYATPGRGARLRTALIWHLLANGHTVRFKAGADALGALYQHELQANATLLSEADVTVHHIRGRTWELRPSV